MRTSVLLGVKNAFCQRFLAGLIPDKGKPFEKAGRKATGPEQSG